MHRPLRKRFLRNPNTVSSIMDLWECDSLDVQYLAKYNDMYRYIVCVIDVFSIYLRLVPVMTKRGPAITSASRSLFHDDNSRRSVCVRTDKGKEFLNNIFRTCCVMRAFTFRFVEIATFNVRSFNVLKGDQR